MAQRGRPKNKLELQSQQAVTVDPLDLCLTRQIINSQEHQAGFRLRWLRSLRFGTATLQSMNISGVSGRNVHHDEEWLSRRQAEYRMVTLRLTLSGVMTIVESICIHHCPPDFITNYSSHNNKNSFINGMGLLAQLYCPRLKKFRDT